MAATNEQSSMLVPLRGEDLAEGPNDKVHHDAFFPKPYNAPAIILGVKALLG
jgi:hypothetical protein